MRKFIKVWHYVYYSIYKLLSKASLIITKPIRLLYRIPAIKRYYRKRCFNPEESFDNHQKNRNLESYNNMHFSLLIMHFLLMAFFFTIYNFALIIFHIYFEMGEIIFIGIIISLILLNSFVLLRDNYIESFLEFDDYNKLSKRWYYVFSLVFIIAVFIFMYFSFIYGSEYHSVK